MPETLGASVVTTKNLLHSTSAWIWLFELDLGGTTGFRLCAHDQNVTVGSLLYIAFPMQMHIERRSASGELPNFEITIGNAGREIITYLEAGQVLDRTLRMKAVYSNDLATVIDFGRASVLSCVVGTNTATLRVGSYLISQHEIPARVWMRGRCPYLYAGAECAFAKTAALAWSGYAAFVASHSGFNASSCDLTLDGANGCRVHGVMELAAGLPHHHPLRYGGNPSIPRGPAHV